MNKEIAVAGNLPNTIGSILTDNVCRCASRLNEIESMLFARVESITAQKNEEKVPEPKRERFPEFFEHIQVQIDQMNDTMSCIVDIIQSIQL